LDEAAGSFRRALSYLTERNIRERADLLSSLAIAERGLERWQAACENLREALGIYINLDDRQMIATSCTQLIGIFVWAGRLQEAIETARRGLSYLGTDLNSDRVRLLAVIGQAYGAAGSWEPANEVLSEALNLASALCDPKLTAKVLGARLAVDYHFLQLREAAAEGEKAESAETGPWRRAVNLQYLCQTLLCLGRLEDAAKIRDELEPLATRMNQSYSLALCRITKVALEFGKTPDLNKFETVLQQLKLDATMPFLFWHGFSELQLSEVEFLRGNWAKLLRHAQEMCRIEADTFLCGAGIGTLFRQMAYGGDQKGALAIFHEKRSRLPRSGRPNTIGSWWMLSLVIEGLYVLGEHSKGAELYPLARELVGTGAVALGPIFRFTHTVAGIAAAAAHEWETAEDHFQTALRQAESFPNLLERAETGRFHAMMLMDRGALGDRERAQTLLNEALKIYKRIRLSRHIEIIRTLLK
jgi:tetratricopeptide (TPR) repeat protein